MFKKQIILYVIIYFSYTKELPEIYQDVLIKGQVIQKGIRECSERYKSIKPILQSLPKEFKVLDIGASQGYFSFKMAEEFNARCTMIEDGYAISNQIWETAEFLKHLCEHNNHLRNITLLKKKFFSIEFEILNSLEKFDLVIAFSVIHHMRSTLKESYENYIQIINEILKLGKVVLIENPINTGPHTKFIRDILLKANGQLIYSSHRNTLLYEIYLFDQRNSLENTLLPNISKITYHTFNGIYTNII